jgi:DNA (cytosine-5)-methyltransferase 1
MKYAELFAGTGGLSLGLEKAGMTCLWHAEIEPYCQRVLSERFPGVPVYGDVKELDGIQLTELHGQLDLLSGGSPCQDMSLAGKRAGLKGSRSSLFFEQMRIWDESEAPLCLWENVYGALSSNNGKDFGRVLSTFVGATVTVPRKKRKRVSWKRSGVVVGPRGVAAWRVLDAQFFGVPQRRRRVFVLGSRTPNICPAKILLEFEGLRGNPQKGTKARKRTSENSGNGIAVTDNGERTIGNIPSDSIALAFHLKQDPISGEVSPALGVTSEGMGVATFDARGNGDGKVVNTLAGDHQNRVTDYTALITTTYSIDKHSGFVSDDISATLKTDLSHQMGPVVTDTREFAQFQAIGAYKMAEISSTLSARDYKDGRDLVLEHPAMMLNVSSGVARVEPIASTLQAGLHKGTGNQMTGVIYGIPRRLMPVECERLMGWPDNWTLISDEKGKLVSDTPRYKAIGNGVATPVAHWIGLQILKNAK